MTSSFDDGSGWRSIVKMKIMRAVTATIVSFNAFTFANLTAVAQAVKIYPYDSRSPEPGSGIDAFINRAADTGSTLLDKTLTGRSLRPAPELERSYPDNIMSSQHLGYDRRRIAKRAYYNPQ